MLRISHKTFISSCTKRCKPSLISLNNSHHIHKNQIYTKFNSHNNINGIHKQIDVWNPFKMHFSISNNNNSNNNNNNNNNNKGTKNNKVVDEQEEEDRNVENSDENNIENHEETDIHDENTAIEINEADYEIESEAEAEIETGEDLEANQAEPVEDVENTDNNDNNNGNKKKPSSTFITRRSKHISHTSENTPATYHDSSYSPYSYSLPTTTQQALFSIPRPSTVLLIPYSPSARPVFPGCVFAARLTKKHLDSIMEMRKKYLGDSQLLVGLFMQKQDNTSATSTNPAAPVKIMTNTEYQDSLYNVGLLASIKFDRDNGLFFLCHRRISINSIVNHSIKLNEPVIVNISHHDDTVRLNYVEDPDSSNAIYYNGSVDEEYEHDKPYDKDGPENDKELIGLAEEIKQKLGAIRVAEGENFVHRNHLVRNFLSYDINNFGQLCDWSAGLMIAKSVQIQQILSAIDIKQRAKLVIQLLDSNLHILNLQSNIKKSLESEIESNNKIVTEQFLKQKKKEIEAKLGGDSKSNKEILITKFTNNMKNKTLPPEITKVIDEEMNKLQSLESDSSEYTITRNYLDWLTSLPYSIKSTDNFDINNAEAVLNADHYGLEDVKNRILEFIATSKLAGQFNQNKILLLVGPPGVGKTSIGKSVSKALNREFFRISVGGLDDVAEVKGHRRTYIGALPGKIIQALKKCGTSNPVILIDEIDKLGRGYRGDPSAALLEILDPEQNKNFTDYYIDAPIDLSKVLFICTANTAASIPPPLADRMEFITISGYVWQEKLQIAKQYLQPQIAQATGILANQINLTDSAIIYMIKWYAREAGVRGLKKLLDTIYRKVALKLARESGNEIATNIGTPVSNPAETNNNLTTITIENLSEYIGAPKFSNDSIYSSSIELPVGVAHGLGWTEDGGQSIFIECTLADQTLAVNANNNKNNILSDTPNSKKKGKKSKPEEQSNNNNAPPPTRGSLIMTGQLGDVMRESVTIAYTVAKRQLALLDPQNPFFHHNKIHLHIPSGATPKDGPSAGITIVCALLSLALNKPITGPLRKFANNSSPQNVAIAIDSNTIPPNPILNTNNILTNTPLPSATSNADNINSVRDPLLPLSPVNTRLAMTGELTLTGRILPIGGVKEKLLAARRADVTDLILPEENQRDYTELASYIKEGITIHFVREFKQVIELAFPILMESKANAAGIQSSDVDPSTLNNSDLISPNFLNVKKY